jgi:hypothetical protein
MEPNQALMAAQANLLNNVTQGDAVDPTQQQQQQPQGILASTYADRIRRRNAPRMQGSMGGNANSPVAQHLIQAKQDFVPAPSDPYATPGTATAAELQTGSYGQPQSQPAGKPDAAAEKAAATQKAWDAFQAQSQGQPATTQPASNQDANSLAQARWRQGEIAAAGGDSNAVQMIRGNAVTYAHAGGVETSPGQAYSNGAGTGQANVAPPSLNFTDDERGVVNAVQAAGGTPLDALHIVLGQRDRAAQQQAVADREANRPGSNEQAKGYLEFQKHSLAAANSAVEQSRKSLLNRVGDVDAPTQQELGDPVTAKAYSDYHAAVQKQQAATDGVTQAYTALGWNALPGTAANSKVQTPRMPIGPDSIPQPYIPGMKLHAGQTIQTSKGMFRVAGVDADGNPQFESAGR